MDVLYFIADWTLNLLGGILVAVAIAIALFFFGAGFMTDSAPSKNLAEYAIGDVGGGCFTFAIGFFLSMAVAGIGGWLIELL